MLNNMNRQEDLTKVFERNWKANHNDDVKNAKAKEKEFMNKMFNTNQKPLESKPLTVNDRVNNLQGNMDAVIGSQKKMNVNNIIKKWK